MNNLKYIFTILLIVLVFAPGASAQTATPKPTVNPSVSPTSSETTNNKLNTQINQLKDKIASRVSELNLVEKRGMIGTVTEVTTNKITIDDILGKSKQIDIDEITKFSSPTTKTAFGLSDIKKGSKISVLGLYNKQSKRLLARFIRTSVDPVFLTGAISEIDAKNFQLDLLSDDQKTTKIDIIQPTTKISSYSDDELTRLLFARLNVGDRMVIVGFPDKTDPNMIVASRVTVFPGLPKDPKIKIEIEPTDVPSATPAPTVGVRRTATPTSSIKKSLTPTTTP